jgi:hypothetical protein
MLFFYKYPHRLLVWSPLPTLAQYKQTESWKNLPNLNLTKSVQFQKYEQTCDIVLSDRFPKNGALIVNFLPAISTRRDVNKINFGNAILFSLWIEGCCYRSLT